MWNDRVTHATVLMGAGLIIIWIFVYGLMIFLPVYTLPRAEERGALLQPKLYHYILAIFLPLLFMPLFTWIPHVIDPIHPQGAHF